MTQSRVSDDPLFQPLSPAAKTAPAAGAGCKPAARGKLFQPGAADRAVGKTASADNSLLNARVSPRQRSRGRQPDGQPNKIDIYIGERIRLRRNALRWPQEKLGNLLGLTFQQIQKYEKGLNRVSASRLYDFASVLGVGVDYFYQDMPLEICAQSPRFIATDAAFNAQKDVVACTDDPLKSSRIQKMVNCFIRIPNPLIADKLFDLMTVLPLTPYKVRKDD